MDFRGIKKKDIFNEEATLPDGGCTSLNQEEEWPSDDSEDDDYDPSRNENSRGNTEGNNTSEDATSSGSLSWSFEDEVFLHSGGSNNIYSDDSIDPTVISGRRRRRAVDYRKLYDVSAIEIRIFSSSLLIIKWSLEKLILSEK